ncbi:hypothetical protein KFK09_009010 [Dendrobium nobile]|uniref:Uncharacterized protein n=1 Tax=Dendrobium nobile TaxID=94219 RepID=A0A8T3BPK8_DENNO|nr:hypothetical protein KFK09_009010 [Dendrobium nobile]
MYSNAHNNSAERKARKTLQKSTAEKANTSSKNKQHMGHMQSITTQRQKRKASA